ncbi:hypothetical protein IP70_21545 [alpha proteobacterium AAP38]|nr:hypothetical protein IP70_21545 [alpha proteobacterium AAP38]
MIEDRLLLTARAVGTRSSNLSLTRKLARSLLGALVEIMVRSNEDARRAPAFQRHDVLLFEHVSVLERRPVSGANPAASKTTDTVSDEPSVLPPQLLQKIDLSVADANLQMRLVSTSDHVVEFRFPRDVGHQLIHVLMVKCRDACWGFSEFDWIDRRANIVIPNGLRPS